VEEGLETRRKARGERTVRMEADEAARLVGEVERERVDEVERARRDVEKRQAASTSIPAPISAPSKLRQGLHTAAVPQPKLMPPTVQPPTRIAHRPTPPPSDDGNSSPTPASRSSSSHRSKRVHQAEGPASPFPSIRAEDEGEFFAALGEPLPLPASARPSPWSMRFTTAPPVVQPAIEKPKSRSRETSPSADPLPPQTVLARVLRELEDDFAHYKACVPSPSSSSASQADGKVCRVYAELADSYKVLDAASAVAKRKILAQHLREVIDTLEQKVSRVSIYHLAEGRLENGEVLGDDEVQADQIASLYELLNFHDKPDNRDSSGKGTVGVKKSVADVLRMVRESLGEEGARRLEEDGVVGRRLHRVV